MNYLKAIAGGLVALAASLYTALDDDTITAQEWIVGIVAVLGSAGVVWYVANGPGSRYAKAVVGSLSAGLTTLAVALDDNVITQQEWVSALIAAGGALGLVAAAPKPN